MRKATGLENASQRVYAVRVQQGKDDASAANVSPEDRERVINAFKRACHPSEEKQRRVAMEKRVREALVRGGAGTISAPAADAESLERAEKIGSSKAGASTGAGARETANAVGQARRVPPPLPPRRTVAPNEITKELILEDESATPSPPECGEDEEREFERLLELAKEASLANPNADPIEEGDEDFEKEMRMAMEMSLAEQRGFERGLLQAAARWREGNPEETATEKV